MTTPNNYPTRSTDNAHEGHTAADTNTFESDQKDSLTSVEMNFPQWCEKFQAIKNTFRSSEFNGYMFDISGPEYAFIIKQPLDRIWSLTWDPIGEKIFIASGDSVFGSHGYFVSTLPWIPNHFYQITAQIKEY
jgi:hypothetical protein